MPNDEPSSALCAKTVRRTVSQLARKLRPALSSDGISVAKLSVIGWIYRCGERAIKAMAAAPSCP
jgi:hypothetical protein